MRKHIHVFSCTGRGSSDSWPGINMHIFMYIHYIYTYIYVIYVYMRLQCMDLVTADLAYIYIYIHFSKYIGHGACDSGSYPRRDYSPSREFAALCGAASQWCFYACTP